MAVVSYADMQSHFDAAQFDALIEAHGTPAVWRKARTCPCIKDQTGQPEIGCSFCDDLGIRWGTDGLEIRILAPGRQRKDEYDVTGMWMQGMMMLTFPSTVTPGHLDRVELLDAVMVVDNERHVRGAVDKLGRSRERLRFRHALSVEFCEAIVNDAIVSYSTPADFTVNTDGDISWSSGKGPPAQTQYTMRYTAKPTYVVWSPQSRDEGAAKMPYRAMAQRLDFFTRPAVGAG